MSTLPDDINNCADSVTGWLTNAASVNEGAWHINLNRGVVAFNRLNGNDDLRPCIFVVPISEASEHWNGLTLSKEHRETLPLVTQLARDPKSAGHFQQLKDNSEVLWGFSPSDITPERIETSKTAFQKFSNKETLSDTTRNLLDLLYFTEGLSIFRVPVPFLGSPLLSCYLESNLTSETFGALDKHTKGNLITKLRSQVVSPLSNLLAVHVALQISKEAKAVFETGHEDADEAKRQFVRQVAVILFAKGVKLNDELIVRPVEPLSWFQSEEIPFGSPPTSWKLVLPKFQTYNDKGDLVWSTHSETHALLKKGIEKHLSDLVELTDKVAEWQRQKDAALEATIYHGIKKDLDNLLRHTAIARLSAQRVEAALSQSHRDYLNHSDELKRLFEEKKTYFYGVEKDKDGNVMSVTRILAKRDEVKTADSEATTSGNVTDVVEIKTVHSPKIVTVDDWSNYANYLAKYGATRRVELFNSLGSLTASDKKEAVKLFGLLKLLMQRSRYASHVLYPLQVVVSCAVAWNNELESRTKEVQFKTPYTDFNEILSVETRDGKKWWKLDIRGLIATSDDKEFADRDISGFRLASGTSCGEFLGSLMDLIQLELIPSGQDDDVIATQVDVKQEGDWLEIFVHCDGCIRDPEERLKLDEHSQSRGLRSLIHLFCRATAQTQPFYIHGMDPNAFNAAKRQFVIGYSEESQTGKGDGKMTWFFCFPRFQHARHQSGKS